MLVTYRHSSSVELEGLLYHCKMLPSAETLKYSWAELMRVPSSNLTLLTLKLR